MGLLNTTPRTWVTGEVVTAAEMNAEVRDALTAVQAVWTGYVPTVTGATITSGTLIGRWNQVGKTVDFFCQFTLGASSAVTGSVTFSLPVTASLSQWTCEANAFDSSVPSTFPLVGLATSTTTVTCRALPSTAGNALAALGAAVPMTWATGDIVTVQGRYEAA